MTSVPTLRDAWSLAAAKPFLDTGLRAAQFLGGENSILATVDPRGHRGLLVTGRADELLQQTVSAIVTASEALGAEIYPFTSNGRNERGLYIWCQRADLTEAFASFCEALVIRIVDAGEKIHSAFIACLDEFRRLVAGSPNGGFGPATVGLIGELVVLSELVQVDPRAIDIWAYPSRDRHDFRNGDAALEVKTSLRSQNSGQTVTITSLDQLDAPAGGTLHLQWLRLERDPEGAISVARLLEEIAAQVDATRAESLRNRVIPEGLSVAHHQKFSLQERHCFRVAAGFPRLSTDRLITGSADAGVGRVHYELDLSVAGEYRCKVDEANRTLLTGRPAA